MNHARVLRRLSAFLDGALESDERAGVVSHLDSCETCRSELLELRSTVELLRGLPAPEPPTPLTGAVMTRIAAGAARPSRLAGWLAGLMEPPLLAPLTAGVVALAVVAVGVATRPGGGESPVGVAVVASESSAGPAAALPGLSPGPTRLVRRVGPQAGLRSSAAAGSLLAAVERDLLTEQYRQLRWQRGLPDRSRWPGGAEMARLLRGAGHPHSAELASHFESPLVVTLASDHPR